MRGYKNFRGVLGHEFVGEVVDASENRWAGKRVCGEINVSCGECDLCRAGLKAHCRFRSVLGILNRPGAFAEYVRLPFANLHEVPDEVADEEAVFVEPLAAAFEIPEQIRIGPKQTVAVLGDGRLGNLCAQVLKMSTSDVIVFGRHERKLAILRDLGIEATRQEPKGDFDIVVEATGSKRGVQEAVSMVKPRGTLVLKSTVAETATGDFSAIVVKEIRVIGSRCGPFQPAIHALSQRVISVSALIDAVYPLSDGIAAFRRAGESGTLKVLIDPRE